MLSNGGEGTTRRGLCRIFKVPAYGRDDAGVAE